MEDSQAGTSASINQMETNRWSYPECGMVGYKDPSHYPSYARAAYTSHVCSTFCKFVEEKQSGLDEYVRVVHSPLMLPLLFGWFREIKSRSYGRNPAIQDRVHYVAPCGKVLGNIEKLQDYLVCVDSILPVTLFTFELDVHLYRKFSIKKACVKRFDEDLAKKILNNPYTRIPVFNCFTTEGPDSFHYVKKNNRSEESTRLLKLLKVENRTVGCSCTGNCGTSCLCFQLIEEGSGYHHGRLYGKKRFVVECNDNCSCGPTCGNRTTTNTFSFPLMLYYYPDRGWGVRALCDVPAGAFITFYHGQIISEKEQSEKTDKYLVALDFAATVAAPVSLQSSLVADDEEDVMFFVDGRRFGNVGRFFNHSCHPNMFVQVVHRDMFSNQIYNVAFFTLQNITAGDELVWDYGYKIGSVPDRVIECLCGARTCRGRML